jgi:hypothetical protein
MTAKPASSMQIKRARSISSKFTPAKRALSDVSFANETWRSQNAFCRAHQTRGSRRRSTTGCCSDSRSSGRNQQSNRRTGTIFQLLGAVV